MGETEKLVKAPENGQHMSLLAKLSSWFTGLKAEFNKIIWPDKQSLARQTDRSRCCDVCCFRSCHRPSGFFDPVWR